MLTAPSYLSVTQRVTASIYAAGYHLPTSFPRPSQVVAGSVCCWPFRPPAPILLPYAAGRSGHQPQSPIHVLLAVPATSPSLP